MHAENRLNVTWKKCNTYNAAPFSLSETTQLFLALHRHKQVRRKRICHREIVELSPIYGVHRYCTLCCDFYVNHNVHQSLNPCRYTHTSNLLDKCNISAHCFCESTKMFIFIFFIWSSFFSTWPTSTTEPLSQIGTSSASLSHSHSSYLFYFEPLECI